VSAVELTEQFLAKIAGWEAIKQARAALAAGHVLSSNWTPPVLKGVVQEGSISYRAGLVVKDAIDLENLCTCRASRQWGTICAHSVAVGLHHLNAGKPDATDRSTAGKPPPSATAAKSAASMRPGKRIRRAGEGEAGEEAEIHVILPPNFTQALTKGKGMLCFEAGWGRGRMPLNALPSGTAFRFSPTDAALLDTLEEISGGDSPAMLLLTTAEFCRVLGRLVGHPHISIGKTQRVSVSSAPHRIAVEAVLQPGGEIRLSLIPGSVPTLLIVGETSWAFANETFGRIGLPPSVAGLLKAPVNLTRQQVPAFLGRDWPLLQANCDLKANFRIEDFILEPRPPRFLLHLAGGLARLEAHLQCAYGPRIMTVGLTSKDESLWLPDPDSPTRYSTRDSAAEQSALGRLLRHGFAGPDANGKCLLTGQNQVLTFFAREFPRMEKEWEVTLEERLERSTSQNIERIEPRLQVTPSGEQWFDLDVSFASSGGERFSAAEIQRLVLSGQSHTRLKNGRFAVIDTGAVEELQEVLLDCAPRQHEKGYRLSNAQAGFLDASLREKSGWQMEAPSAWRERALRQSGDARLDVPPLEDLEGVLRPYQKHGVAWLRFLRDNGFGGILADEMGLGKTLQVLAFLRSIFAKRLTGRATGKPGGSETAQGRAGDGGVPELPALVVCPTSLVFNWVAEARKFTPTLKVLSLHGPQRHTLFAEIPESDIVVTSYSLIRRDAEMYRGLEFDTVVLDEAQHIKNRQSQNSQAVKTIRAHHRLVLTGTPLENSVLDLWSIFDFLMPGYLGAAADFRERYEAPIVRSKDGAAQARLARRVKPFLLRRLKKDVAADLPKKIEQVSFCELTEDQRTVYQQVLDAGRKEVTEAVGQRGLEKSRLVVLNALLRLRQICCDLRLLKLDNTSPDTASGKLEMFGELIEEVIDGGHRVLVFSQFVGMLKLLEERLRTEEIDYCYLDGSTVDRAGVVERFQTNAAIPVFLISLKAGGVGLNLTGADTVIHFDPWWNPAVEDQATDRAHRIGQTRVVSSYKLITRGTVEEKILALQNRKRAVIQSVLAGEEEFTSALNWEEIQELLGGS
jgi:superfamily II DNA or RNA helicase